MPPYETFTAFWMLSTLLLNWMFANKSHGAGGWHDSPSASLRVILPCNAQGKQICIPSMTNLAVCFHWAGVHIIYFFPPLSSPLSLPVSFSFSLHHSHYASLLRDCQCVILQSSVTSPDSARKTHFLLDLVSSVVRRETAMRCWRHWHTSGVEHHRERVH